MHVQPPSGKKSSASEMSKRGEKVPTKKNVHLPLRYDKLKTKKVGKKEDISKRKGIKLKK